MGTDNKKRLDFKKSITNDVKFPEAPCTSLMISIFKNSLYFYSWLLFYVFPPSRFLTSRSCFLKELNKFYNKVSHHKVLCLLGPASKHGRLNLSSGTPAHNNNIIIELILSINIISWSLPDTAGRGSKIENGNVLLVFFFCLEKTIF